MNNGKTARNSDLVFIKWLLLIVLLLDLSTLFDDFLTSFSLALERLLSIEFSLSLIKFHFLNSNLVYPSYTVLVIGYEIIVNLCMSISVFRIV